MLRGALNVEGMQRRGEWCAWVAEMVQRIKRKGFGFGPSGDKGAQTVHIGKKNQHRHPVSPRDCVMLMDHFCFCLL